MRIIVTIDVSCSIYSLYDYNDLSVGNLLIILECSRLDLENEVPMRTVPYW